MDDMTKIPFIAYEHEISRMERIIKRLIIALVISIFLIFINNAMWLFAWMQYDYSSTATTTETVTVDGKDGVANYIGNDGDINNGKDNGAESNNTDTDPDQNKGK